MKVLVLILIFGIYWVYGWTAERKTVLQEWFEKFVRTF